MCVHTDSVHDVTEHHVFIYILYAARKLRYAGDANR